MELFEGLRNAGFDVLALHHAEAILRHDMPDAVSDIQEVLLALRIPVLELVGGGGGETKLTQRLRKGFAARKWKKENVEVKKLIGGREIISLSHEIDHVRHFGNHLIALEIEWNNKDPFFDRDLESFKRLHAEGAISVGIIITRGQSLQSEMRTIITKFARDHDVQSFEDLSRHGYHPTRRQIGGVEARVGKGKSFSDAWAEMFVADKFGEATTHWRKLDERVRRGIGNPCPLVLIGIPSSAVID